MSNGWDGLFPDGDDPRRHSLSAIRLAEQALVERHEELTPLVAMEEVNDKMLQLCLDAMRAAEAELTDHPDNDVLTAFVVLGTRLLQHSETIRSIVPLGLNGDATVILRVMVSEQIALKYLCTFPAEVPLWRALATGRDMTDKQHRKAMAAFSDGAMAKRLKQANIECFDVAYSDLSEAAHGTMWGSQFYLTKTAPNTMTVYYGAGYDPIRSVDLVSMAALYVQQFVETLVIGWPEELKSPQARDLARAYSDLIGSWMEVFLQVHVVTEAVAKLQSDRAPSA